MLQRMVNFLVNNRFSLIRRVGLRFLRIFGLDIPGSVCFKGRVTFAHGGLGVVIHPRTTIGHSVKIYQQVTIGRSDIWNDTTSEQFEGVFIGDNVIICTGAKILTSRRLDIGAGSIIGANSVLTKSTGENEIWAGIPAKFIRKVHH